MQVRLSLVLVVGAVLTVLAVVALSVAPAFGQAIAIDDGDDIQYNGVCQNIIGSIGDIDTGNTATANSTSNANSAADNDSEAASEATSAAEIAQESGLTIEQVNECLNGVDSNNVDDNNNTNDRESTNIEGSPSSASAASASTPAGVKSATIPDVKALVNTGGFPILAGAGLMLVASIAVGTRMIGRR